MRTFGLANEVRRPAQETQNGGRCLPRKGGGAHFRSDKRSAQDAFGRRSEPVAFSLWHSWLPMYAQAYYSLRQRRRAACDL